MNVNLIITYIAKAGVFLTALFAAYIVYKFTIKALKKGSDAGQQFIKSIDKNIQKKGDMSKKQLYMSKIGIMYRFGKYDLKPSDYFSVRLLCGILVSAIFYLLAESFSMIIVGFPIGYFGIDILFKILNGRDNEDMTIDIYNTYANLKIQLSAGIYIGECLEYSYKITKNERYREALKELLLNFSDKTITSSEAVEIFRNRFESREIDQLCAMITSFIDYGLSDSYLDGIMFEVQQLLESDAEKSQQNIESKTGFITFAFFVLVVILVAVNMVGSLDGIGGFL